MRHLLSPLQSQSCSGKTANLHLLCTPASVPTIHASGKAHLWAFQKQTVTCSEQTTVLAWRAPAGCDGDSSLEPHAALVEVVDLCQPLGVLSLCLELVPQAGQGVQGGWDD